MDDWLSLGATVLGGLLGGSDSGGGTTSTSTNSSDPRFNKYLYDSGGVLPSASNWYQNNSTGLNEQSLAGLNRQYAVASDPNTAQGYTNMQSLGSSLMGGAVAGNPFTDGRMGNLGKNLGQTQQPTMGGMSFNNPAAGGTGFNGGGAFTQPTYQTQNAAPPTLQDLINKIGGGAGVNFGSGGAIGGGSGGDNMGPGVAGGLSGLGGLGGFSMDGLVSGLLDNQNTVNAIAGGVFGPAGGIFSRAALGLLGAMPAGVSGTGLTSPNSVGGIHNYGSMNDSRQNAEISTSMNQSGMGGYGGFGGRLGGGFSGYGGGGYGGYGAGDPDGF